MLCRGRRQEHLWHRRLPGPQHRAAARAFEEPAAQHHSLSAEWRGHLCAGRLDPVRGRRHSMAARWSRAHLAGLGCRGAGGVGARTAAGCIWCRRSPGWGRPTGIPMRAAAIIGLTRASSRAQIARAALDSVAYQTYDLLDAMAADGLRPESLKVDGGMAQNNLLMQRLADVLGMAIQRPANPESTAFGAACLAGLGCGLYRSRAGSSPPCADRNAFQAGSDGCRTRRANLRLARCAAAGKIQLNGVSPR